MIHIVLFGPPGCGKGTQSAKLIEKYQLVHLSTGDILRNELANRTELGMQAKKLMDQGVLVPDEVVIGMISTKLKENNHAKGFIFDGFPRTRAQASALDKLLLDNNASITAMLSLSVEYEELVKRILHRGKNSGRSDDNDPDIIRKRIDEYNSKTAPLIDFYKEQNKYYSVEGQGSVEEIFAKLCSIIDDILLKKESGT